MVSPQRIRLPAVYDAEYAVSPIVEWLHAMDLVAMADQWGEGFATWVYETQRAMSGERYAELVACNAAVSWPRLLSIACYDLDLAQDFGWLSDWLRGQEDAKAYVRFADEQLPEAAGTVRGEASVAAMKAQLGDEWGGRDEVLTRAVDLIRHPQELKETYIHTAEAFLEEHLRVRWEEDRPLLEEEVERHRKRSWSGTLPTLIERLTGRAVALSFECDRAEQLIALPTRLLGPFITLTQIPRSEETLVLLYGLQSGAEARGRAIPSSEAVAGGFKALGDETRWRILQLVAEREMYAHEIGLQFSDLGQAAISRHLRYLAAEGLLSVRDVQAKKYYTLNRDAVQRLSAQLDILTAPAAPRDPERNKDAE